MQMTADKKLVELLQFMADGKTIKDAAPLAGYRSPAGAKQRLHRAFDEFDVENSFHLLATALRQGLID